MTPHVKPALTLELIGATFDATNESPSMEDLPERPKFVSRFVPLPPVEPAQALGRTPDPFRLSDRTGRIKIDVPSSDRKVTVILFVTADKRSIWNAVAFNQWTSMMTADVAAKSPVDRGHRSRRRKRTASGFVGPNCDRRESNGSTCDHQHQSRDEVRVGRDRSPRSNRMVSGVAVAARIRLAGLDHRRCSGWG